MNTLFLTIDEVIEIHENQIATYGGTLGIRDEGLLRSAIAQPEANIDLREVPDYFSMISNNYVIIQYNITKNGFNFSYL